MSKPAVTLKNYRKNTFAMPPQAFAKAANLALATYQSLEADIYTDSGELRRANTYYSCLSAANELLKNKGEQEITLAQLFPEMENDDIEKL